MKTIAKKLMLTTMMLTSIGGPCATKAMQNNSLINTLQTNKKIIAFASSLVGSAYLLKKYRVPLLSRYYQFSKDHYVDIALMTIFSFIFSPILVPISCFSLHELFVDRISPTPLISMTPALAFLINMIGKELTQWRPDTNHLHILDVLLHAHNRWHNSHQNVAGDDNSMASVDIFHSLNNKYLSLSYKERTDIFTQLLQSDNPIILRLFRWKLPIPLNTFFNENNFEKTMHDNIMWAAIKGDQETQKRCQLLLDRFCMLKAYLEVVHNYTNIPQDSTAARNILIGACLDKNTETALVRDGIADGALIMLKTLNNKFNVNTIMYENKSLAQIAKQQKSPTTINLLKNASLALIQTYLSNIATGDRPLGDTLAQNIVSYLDPSDIEYDQNDSDDVYYEPYREPFLH